MRRRKYSIALLVVVIAVLVIGAGAAGVLVWKVARLSSKLESLAVTSPDVSNPNVGDVTASDNPPDSTPTSSDVLMKGASGANLKAIENAILRAEVVDGYFTLKRWAFLGA